LPEKWSLFFDKIQPQKLFFITGQLKSMRVLATQVSAISTHDFKEHR